MRIRILMSSGKEYITTKYSSVENLLQYATGNSVKVNFTSVDDDKTIFINGDHISSIEVLGE